MKPQLSLLFLFLTMAPNAMAELLYEKSPQGLCLKAYSTTNSYDRTFEPHSLEAQYCERMYMTDINQFFTIHTDMPATQIDTNSKDINQSFYKQLTQAVEFNDSIKTSAPWGSILELNLHADQLWQEMLSCSEGDPEKARDNYYQGKWSCGGKNLKKQITDYHTSILLLLETSEVREVFSVSPKVHPLYTQVLLEIYSALTKNNYLERNAPLPYRFQAEIKNVKAAYEKQSSETVELLQRAYDIDVNNPTSVQYGKMLVNLFNLLSALPKECKAFGFWPGAARTLIESYSNIHNSDDLNIHPIRSNVLSSCGKAYSSSYFYYIYPFVDIKISEKVYLKYRQTFAHYYERLQ